MQNYGRTLNTLRHSLATCLPKSGVDFIYIQELLGHKNSKINNRNLYSMLVRKTLAKKSFR
ncbi:MAG TPA: tyrosine-type recombinase/integrase [Candidatus Atribacteria bacterium]|nr:tyrosine-type recombinase/integrase [Candidatus Atribacteria bacterium]HOQ51112.1 tyrosine-type recombinase/integrase [Candidatus Atribacteria bacterium]HPZ39484.1 tyrosine-type recombinase/integrase [Candidatus Atribacteria bacterium]HQD32878.1 tyrosine-type recombinase/integrase [Candidatus Atribacteria bacterium]